MKEIYSGLSLRKDEKPTDRDRISAKQTLVAVYEHTCLTDLSGDQSKTGARICQGLSEENVRFLRLK